MYVAINFQYANYGTYAEVLTLFLIHRNKYFSGNSTLVLNINGEGHSIFRMVAVF